MDENELDYIKNIESVIYYNHSFSSNLLPYYVWREGNPYFNITTGDCKHNIFNLVGIQYKITNGNMVITENKSLYTSLIVGSFIITINGEHPSCGMIDNKKYYDINFIYKIRNGLKRSNVRIFTPTIKDSNSLENHCNLNGNNLYIRLNNFSNKINFIENIFGNNYQRLYLDLRGNAGGKINNLIRIARMLVGNLSPLFYLKKADNIFCINSTDETCSKIVFDKCYVFIDRKTLSSAELLCEILKRNVVTKFLGERTGGKRYLVAVHQFGEYKVSIPEYIYSTFPDDFPKESHIEPDICVSGISINEFIRKKFDIAV